MSCSKIPSSNISEFILSLAQAHCVEYSETSSDKLAKIITNLSDDSPNSDPIELLLIELRRAGAIDRLDFLPLLTAYLRENGNFWSLYAERKGYAKHQKIEHNLFVVNLPHALQYLRSLSDIGYGDFLETHRILFSEFYPWAGKDRTETAPDIAVRKGPVLFSHPHQSRLAVEQVLRIGQRQQEISIRHGEVMGLFAYGHPFLDGNGRVMLLMHLELCHRAGFSIAWQNTNKTDYL